MGNLKKQLEDFIEKNFSGQGNGPRTMFGSLKTFKTIYPEEEWNWNEAKYINGVKTRAITKGNIKLYLTEHREYEY